MKCAFSTHNILSLRGFDGRVTCRHETPPVVGRQHFDSSVKVLLEPIAYVSERWHFTPARPQRARTRQTMTLALQPHVILHRLQQNTNAESSSIEQEFYYFS
jgi:hypothetical protein